VACLLAHLSLCSDGVIGPGGKASGLVDDLAKFFGETLDLPVDLVSYVSSNFISVFTLILM
jgi:hypothetical protein